MPVGTDNHDNGGFSWWAADVAADDSGKTTVFGGDIRPTSVHSSPFTIDHFPLGMLYVVVN